MSILTAVFLAWLAFWIGVGVSAYFVGRRIDRLERDLWLAELACQRAYDWMNETPSGVPYPLSPNGDGRILEDEETTALLERPPQ